MFDHAYLPKRSGKRQKSAAQRGARGRYSHRTAVQRCGLFFEHLESRVLLVSDFGDAPDLTAGTGVGDYQTLAANGGPSHVIDATATTLFLGNRVDGDSGLLQNADADADDVDGVLPDDEDGVLSPLDLLGTEGTQPKVTLLITNMSVGVAMVSGWIDYNADGVFDNATERAQATIGAGTMGARVTLLFPTIPVGSAGNTYVRFRLSTDVAAQNANGTASGGEVEDYAFSITARASQPVYVDDFIKIASGIGGGPPLSNGDYFGFSMTSLGDLDGDGVADLVIGSVGDDTGGTRRGAVHVLFMNSGGAVNSTTKIAHNLNGGPALADGDNFGSSVASLGDLDGDGVVDLAVGARGDGQVGIDSGAIHVLFMNPNGTVKSRSKIASNTGGGPTLANGDYFGSSVASLGDLDGDGVADLAVGAYLDDTGGSSRGAVHVLFMNANGTVKSRAKIAHNLSGGPPLANDDLFGSSVASLGDLDGDGVADLAVGAYDDDTGGSSRGAVHVLFMNPNGTVKSSTKIAHNLNGGPQLANYDLFGRSITSPGDLDGDGVADLAVGVYGDDTGGSSRGAVHVLLLNPSGTVKISTKIASGTGGGPTLNNLDYFGISVASLGDLDGDGVADLAVGASGDDTGGGGRGAVHVLFLASPGIDYGDAPDSGPGTAAGNYETTATSGGPSHFTGSGVFLGNTEDVDSGLLQNADADADDVDGLLPDDEDGVLSPLDLLGTEGAQPTVTLLVTNASVSSATVSGWIDYNADGVFDNATERAQATVAAATADGRVTLVFPTIPFGSADHTYARFRISTDAVAQNPIGAASNGEVEDYMFSITSQVDEPIYVDDSLKIANGTNGGPTLVNDDLFGDSVASIGDLNGDGIGDMAVGAHGDNTGGNNRGAIYVLRMNSNGTVGNSTKIASGINGGPTLANDDVFGRTITALGDLDGDGIVDLAVGAQGDDTGGADRGAVYVLFMNANGTVKGNTKIASGIGGGPTLLNGDSFGISAATLGDLDGDGVADLAVGSHTDDTGGLGRGAVHVLFMNSNGTVRSSTKIAHNTNGGPTLADYDHFGVSAASLGDIDGDGVADLAVGAFRDDTATSYTSGSSRGAVYVLFLNPNGTVKSREKIANNLGGGPALSDGDEFGVSVASLGDLDGDGVADLAVGARYDDRGGANRGALHLLLMNTNGTAKSSTKIAHNLNGGPALADGDYFGRAVASPGDLNGDGLADLFVGAPGDNTGGANRGAVHALFLTSEPLQVQVVVDTVADEFDGNYSAGDLSLREAIGIANSFTAPFTIDFSPSVFNVPRTIQLTLGQLAITNSVAINGPGANLLTIDASGNDPSPTVNNGDGSRIFDIDDGFLETQILVEIAGLTLTGGDVSGTGGAIECLRETLIIIDSAIRDNNAIGTNGDGGGVAMAQGGLTIIRSILSGNTAGDDGGAIFSFGGDMTIIDSLISRNRTMGVGYGGGINAFGGNLLISGTTISDNFSPTQGGGMRVLLQGTKQVQIKNSTISGNQANAEGGGLSFLPSGGALTIAHTTIAQNTADFDGNGTGRGGGVTMLGNFAPSVSHSIIAGNLDNSGTAPDFSGPLSGSYTMIGNTTGSTPSGSFLFLNVNPMLGPLGFNGGLTPTHSLLPGSPAIDSGDPSAVAGVGAVPLYDQRGAPFTRVFNGDGMGGARIDIGAFELQPFLLGDYNQNGVVDAADNTVWRNTLGNVVAPFSGADGSGNGIIDQADRLVWMANFGRTASAAGTVAVAMPATAAVESLSRISAIAAEPIDVDASPTMEQPERAESHVAKSATIAIPPTYFFVDAPAHSDGPRTYGPRSVRLIHPAVAALHDDALSAWVASRSRGIRSESTAVDIAGWPIKADGRASTIQPLDVLDVAFESLGV